MNTSKQINVMVILIFLLLIVLGAYTIFDPTREQQATAAQTDLLAQRGAALFAANCRPCHGDLGQGRIGPALNRPDLRDPAKLAQNESFVRDTITCGRVGTLMPTWGQAEGGPLSDEQIRELVTLITVDPTDSEGNDSWTRFVKPDSEAANAVATPLAVEDLLKGSITGSTASVCGQKVAVATTAEAATPGTPATTLAETTTDNKFSATNFTVPAGQAVTMSLTNQGNAIHNWHVTDVKDDSGKDITTGATGTLAKQTSTVTFTISKAGTYHFQCDFHPTEMLGTLFVVAPGGATAGTAAATPAVGAPGGGAGAGSAPAAPAAASTPAVTGTAATGATAAAAATVSATPAR